MITVEDALTCLRQEPVTPVKGFTDLETALNRVLADDIDAPLNMPPFHKSAMDGYAVASVDPGPRYRIIETIAAGSVPERRITSGECSKIMTGAMLPEGADRVIKKEVTREEDGFMMVTAEDSVDNVCRMGEDIRAGDRVLNRGSRIGAAELGLLASMGLRSVPVYRQVVAGILTTGSEIREPGETLAAGQIFNSNAYTLQAQIRLAGGRAEYGGIAVDEPAVLKQQVEMMLSRCDVVIVSGGVSVGEFDFVPDVLSDLGVRLHFRKVAVKPGKPTVFGTIAGKFVFGLPGNPVSTFVIFEIFIKPFLLSLMGHTFQPQMIQGVMKSPFRRKKSRRTAFIPVTCRQGMIEPVEYHGSAHLGAIAAADALLEVPSRVTEIAAGSSVYVRLV